MLTLVTLGGLAVTALAIVFTLGLLLFLVKAVVLLVLLPIRLVFGLGLHLLLLPLRLAMGLLILPVLLVGGVLAVLGVVVAGVVAVAVPLAPVVLVGLLIWALVKASRRPVALVR